MNTLLLKPTDILFFRDGRPMGGSLSGHGAAWPLPSVTSAALHAALHRADIKGIHPHRRGKSGSYTEVRDRKFGSLVTAGPFPVLENNWLFPRPLDAGLDAATPTLLPLKDSRRAESSLPKPLLHPVANTLGPTKFAPATWWNRQAWETYLETACTNTATAFHRDSDFADTEFCYGIGIDPASGTQDGERFYSAHYLRLRENARIGLIAEAHDKEFRSTDGNSDLIAALFPNSGTESPVIVGGQQRICTVLRETPSKLPLPVGKSTGFNPHEGKFLLKWVLLTPAIYPTIEAGLSKRGTERVAHPGGWLPTWICPDSGRVLLETISGQERKRRRHLNAAGKGYPSNPDIDAQLVAAATGKPVPVTGYAIDNGLEDRAPGPKPTHLAVPAGSVYYFECPNAEAAAKLAAALNWHGPANASSISNRRSTLMGEKGFGLGICGTWSFHNGERPS